MIHDHPFRQDMGGTGEGVSLLHVEGFCQVLGTIADGKSKTVPQRIQSRKQALIFVSLIHFLFPCSRNYAQFPQAGNQVFLRSVAFDAVAVGAEELQIVDVIVAAGVLWDDVVRLGGVEPLICDRSRQSPISVPMNLLAGTQIDRPRVAQFSVAIVSFV